MRVLFKVSQGLELNIQKTKIMASGSNHFMENRWRNNENSDTFIFLGSKITETVTAATKLKDACSWEEKL